MMLYVFHVDVGRMMSFDMTVALSSVENLKDTIERLHGIPAANIVLLVSGGEMLTESTQVSYYSAGTDTNPIYMFLTGDVVKLPAIMPQTDSDLDLRNQVERSMELPAVYETVVTRTQLALKMYEYAREEYRLCERLVHDQHLQQQGWSAVVANMEDLTNEFRLRFRNFCTFFDRHLEQRPRHLELLRNFSADLVKLSRIPILPGLMPLAEADFHGFDEYLDNDDVFTPAQQQQQQESAVLMAGADTVTAASSDETSEACDTSSTSPHKKQKMGEDETGGGGGGGGKEQSLPLPTTTTTASSPPPLAATPASTKIGSQGGGGAMRRITLNLLQWITSKENHNALQIMSNECIQGLNTFNEEVYEKLKAEVQNTIKIAEQGDVKEIKGLGERLCKLEEFKYKIKSMVQDQKEHSTGFQQNHNRAINLRDPSILPDLCDSHRSQLFVMLQNHKKILDLRRCIAKAKDELGTNLHMRLSRIVCIENAMSDIDNRLLFYHRCLRRAERHISIIEQIHQAPCIYVAAVTEVVRRKIFSEEFGKWASKLSDDFDSIHSEEVNRREMFNASFEGHFLNILFPGMNDMPPTFANENPLAFDARLPNLTKSDIDFLSSYLPDLAPQIQLPDMLPIIRFFVSRSGEHQKERWEQLLKDQQQQTIENAAAAASCSSKNKAKNARITEIQKEAAEESETDTEIEFEKVPPAAASTASGVNSSVVTSQAQIESSAEEKPPPIESESLPADTLTRSTLTERCLLMTSAETLTDDNGTATRDEIERLRNVLTALSEHSLECIRIARCNLTTFRTDALAYRDDLQSDIQALQDTCKVVRMRCEEREQQLLQENHTKSMELESLHTQLQARDAEIDQLRSEVSEMNALREKCDFLTEQIKEIQSTFKKEKDTAVAMAREELIHEHKTEIESLRCRFKLMTSMERSPSDMSLEKIERPTSRLGAVGGTVVMSDENPPPPPPPPCDMIDLKQHEAIKLQLIAEKERAILAAVEAERMLWQSKLTLNSESVMANVGILKVIEEKERQLEQLRERELMLTKENFQLKTRLDALTNEDANSWLKEKIEYLHRDKERLEKELEKSRRQEMEASFAGSRGGLTYEHNLLPRSKSSGSSHKYAVLQSLEKGDVVFTVWSSTYGQYIVVQDSQSLFFVHGESLASLKLQLPKRKVESPVAPVSAAAAAAADDPVIPMPFYAVGIVMDKEYCQARKDENRYRMPRGSKFYRVKLAPLTIAQPTARIPRDRLESCSKSVSRSQSQCESQSEASAAAITASAIGASVIQVSVAGVTAVGSDSKDVTDAGTTTTTTTTPTTTSKRNRSSSVSKCEEDEQVQLLQGGGEACRYISVSEEEESSITTTTTTATTSTMTMLATSTTTNTTTTTAHQQQQSVITEQPTASNKIKLDLMLITPTQNPIPAHEEEEEETHIDESPMEHKDNSEQNIAAASAASTPAAPDAAAAAAAPPSAIPISFGTTSEDSDEYRSLEGKEDETAIFENFD